MAQKKPIPSYYDILVLYNNLGPSFNASVKEHNNTHTHKSKKYQ